MTDDTGKPQLVNDFFYIYRHNYPNLTEDEAIFDFTNSADAPVSGWSSVKPPISLDALVTDGTSWPLRIHTKVSQQAGDCETLAGAAVLTPTN